MWHCMCIALQIFLYFLLFGRWRLLLLHGVRCSNFDLGPSTVICIHRVHLKTEMWALHTCTDLGVGNSEGMYGGGLCLGWLCKPCLKRLESSGPAPWMRGILSVSLPSQMQNAPSIFKYFSSWVFEHFLMNWMCYRMWLS